MSDFEERIELVEISAAALAEQYRKLFTQEELDDMVTKTFDDIRDLEDRIIALTNRINIFEQEVQSLTKSSE